MPFPIRSKVEVVELHLRAAPPAPSSVWPDIPRVLDQLIVRMMSKSAAARPTLPEVRAALAQVRNPSTHAVGAPGSDDGPTEQDSMSDLPVPPALIAPRGRWRATGLFFGAGMLVAVLAVTVFGLIALRAQPAPTVTVRPRKPPPALPPLTAAVESLPRPGTLAISVDVPDARISVDGRVAGESVRHARVLVEQPGHHDIEVSAAGRPTFRTRVQVGEGATVDVAARLGVPAPGTDAPSRRAPRSPAPPSSAPAPAPSGDELILDPYRRKP
jgi:hypothetical protein